MTRARENADLPVAMTESGGKVGVGTSPQASLHINDIGSTGPALLIEGASSTEGDIVVPHNESLQVGHWNASTNTFTERFKIDTSGRITMPAQPHGNMTKSSSGNQDITSTGSHKITFQSNSVTNGITFDGSNHRLTVPAAGNYMIAAMASGSISAVVEGDGVYLQVRKNGSNVWGLNATPLSSTGGANGVEWAFTDAFVVALAANDYIELWLSDVGNGLNFNINRARVTVTMLG